MLKIHLILSYQSLSDIPADHLPIGAFFLGFPGDRFSLLEKYQEKWTHSEIALQNAIESLRAIDVSNDKKDDLLKKSNTGPYWDKYGAICGMFRFAKVYSTLGANGLTKAIKNLNIPYC